MKWRLVFLLSMISLGVSSPVFAADVGTVVNKLNEINTMRESLAESLTGTKDPITEETFKNVCAPVGKSLQSWAQEGGYKARQLSHKFRNPNNKAEGHDLKIIREFERDKNRLYVIENKKMDGIDGVQVYRRIDVRQNCLHCHGEAQSRPDFIKTKYPKDLAHGFKPGDLRGIYSVWIKNQSAP